MTDIRTLQTRLGVTADGVFGPLSVAAANAKLDSLDSLLALYGAKPPQSASATSGPPRGVSLAGGAEIAAAGAISPSPSAFAIIKEFEGYAKALPDGGCRAYPDPASGGDPWTIGFGSTGPDVKPGTVWTRAQAEARLERDVTKFAAEVARLVSGANAAKTEQREFDAMVSLAYNIGLANFGSSTLLKKHRAGDKAGAAEQFVRWNKAAGRVMAGLTRRREAEAKLYRGAA